MNVVWPIISFFSGLLFSLFMQWMSYRLSFKKDQKKEYWIRKLNSYQDFCQHMNQLSDLLRTGIVVPDNIFWQSISLARKAAFDAEFFDCIHPDRPKEMQKITNSLIKIFQSKSLGPNDLDTIGREIEKIQTQFCEDENLSWETNCLRSPQKH